MSKRKKPQSEKPKKSLTAYVLYCGEKRSKLKEEQPDLTFAEVGKELGRLWRELSQDEKQPFSDKAKELKTEYDVAIKKYKEEHPDSSDDEKRSRKKRKTGKGKKGKKGKKGSRKKKDKNAPKRPKTGFMFFSQDMRSIVKQEKPDATFAETGKLLGERWGNASPEDRKKYNDKSEEDKERYKKEMANYTPPAESSSSDSSSSESDSSSSDSDSSSSSESEEEKKPVKKKKPQKKETSSESESD